MGVSESTQISNLKSTQFYFKEINLNQWNQIPNYSYTRNFDPYYASNYKILSNKLRNNYQIQKYQLFFNSFQQFKTYEQSYQWRKTQKYLVQPRFLKQRINRNMCSTFHQATIYLERIPIRACQITDIPIQEGLYLLYCSFMGFRKIYQKTGYFQVTLDMICFNRQAMVRIWLNNNLSKNLPQFYLINQNYTQSDFIFKILQLCQPLIDFNGIGQKFSQFLMKIYQQKIKNCKAPKNVLTDQFNSNSSQQGRLNSQRSCKYSPVDLKNSIFLTKSTIIKNTKQSLNLVINFDKIIDYFELYLQKYNLILARQMKSIKDLFKIQRKIQYEQDIKKLNQKKNKIIKKHYDNQKIQEQKHFVSQHIPKFDLKIRDEKSNIFLTNTIKKKKKLYERKSTKRTNTDRSQLNQNQNKKISILSQNIVFKNENQYKQECKFYQKKKIPEISFSYRPIQVNSRNFNNIYSPQNFNKIQHWPKPRQRIKTLMNPNISINIQNNIFPKPQIFCNYHRRQKSSSTNFQFNNTQRVRHSFHSPINQRILNNNNFHILNHQNKDQNNIFKKKNGINQILELNQFNKVRQNLDFKNQQPIYYSSSSKQYLIDDQIMKDLNKFNMLQQNTLVQQ